MFILPGKKLEKTKKQQVIAQQVQQQDLIKTTFFVVVILLIILIILIVNFLLVRLKLATNLLINMDCSLYSCHDNMITEVVSLPKKTLW